jgi:ankyrin repeat protein
MPFELHRESKRGNLERVRELLREGADVNAKDRQDRTPLTHALKSPSASVELVQLLLDSGGTVAENSRFDGENTSVAAVCLRGGDPLKLALLLERGADVLYQSAHGYDALMDAVYSHSGDRDQRLLDMLQILIAHGVPLNGITSYNESALRVLSRLGRFDAIQLLLDAGADESQLTWTPLHRAVALGSLEDVKAEVKVGAALEDRDWWERTPWLVAVRTGDLGKAQYLLDCGADYSVTGKGDISPLNLAIDGFHTPMLRWLLELGLSVEGFPDCSFWTPLQAAVEASNVEAVEILLAAGADVNRIRPGLRHAQTREIALRLLGAGADPAELSSAGRRAILRLEPEPDDLLFDATHEDFSLAPTACWGETNPEPMEQPFWQAMIRSGINAYAAAQIVGGNRDDGPVWCADRFGQSLTLLSDGRAIQIGGEHEDFYDSDFCIYNDVFVHHSDGRIDIYCYPEDDFPPTDFHTETQIGDWIYIIGGLGYQGSRRVGETPVYRLNIHTLRIDRVESTGEPPGWISRHRAELVGANEIRVWGGKVTAESNGKETYEDNSRSAVLDVRRGVWRFV